MPDDQQRSHRTRRDVLKTTGAASVVATAGLAGCFNDSGGSDSDVEIIGVWADAEQEDFSAVMDYAEGETDLSLSYSSRTTDALLSNTLVDYENGTATADIVVMPSPARVMADGENGHLADLGDTWDAENFAVDPDRVSGEGGVYAAPFKMDLKPGFWYRKSFFDEHDLSEPESWDEFMTLLADIAEIDGVDAPIASGNGTGWPLSDITEGFFMRQENGAELQQNLINGEASFTDDRVTTAFEEIKMLHDEEYFSVTRDFGVQYEYFWDGSCPLYFMGSFTPAQDAVQDPSDLGVFRMPGGNGITSSINWLTVPTYSSNVEDAKEAVSSIVSAGGQEVWAERGGFIATNTQVPSDAYQIEVMAQLPQLANEVTVVPDLDDALGDPFQSEFWSQLKGLWASPNTDVDDITSSLDTAHEETLSE
ncbi:ABC transporter substrate-binding protein [Salinarchaeum laminariae]|uniref:ABC transporter substrate-binding protein n=1 Tax=Salinarchaeum laminariae TaxID=869888 RepID=UPI0020C01C42|nr:ABC transporter substrate-binding protein [Salinarchaeum laminariae]